MSEASVSIRDVSKRFGSVEALRSVSLDIPRGAFLTVVGKSGSGKTTLLRTVGGFEQPDNGRILFAGRDVTDEPPHRRRSNTVFQSYALFPHLSVFANVAFGLEQEGVRGADLRHRVTAILEALDIAELARRKPHQLSGGQSQRVALARALVKRPEVLLLDEPFSALDPQTRDRARGELRALLARYDTSVLMVTHDQEEAMAMSSLVALIRDGSLVQVGSPVELYRRPVNTYAAEFFGTANLFRGTILAHSADRTAIRHEGSGATLFAQSAPGLAPGALVDLVVRPEAVRVVQNGEGMIAARLESRMFLGREWEWVAVAEGDVRVTLRLPGSAGEPPGTDIRIGWIHDDALLIGARDD